MTESAQPAKEADLCVVGAGPAGVVLSYIAARAGLRVVLLEAQADFEREFRGDTIHPATLELLEALELVSRVLEIPHTRLDVGRVVTPTESAIGADFRTLRSNYPYIALVPQARLIETLVTEASGFPGFSVHMHAVVRALEHREDGVVTGVRAGSGDAAFTVRARLVIGADGRASAVRRLAGIEVKSLAPPMDVCWFKLPRYSDDPEPPLFSIADGHMLVRLDRRDHWQVGYVIAKGDYRTLHDAGIDAFRAAIARIDPSLKERLSELESLRDVQLLNVASGRARRWWQPGLLLIGDAAHIMSPVGGVGINMAIQDAVAAANVLVPILKSGDGEVPIAALRKVVRKRMPATLLTQFGQGMAQRQLAGRFLKGQDQSLPPALKLPFTPRIAARALGMGFFRTKLDPALQEYFS